MVWLAVAAGGAIGTLARHGVNLVFGHVFVRAVPYATAAVNVAGSFVIGFLAGRVASGRMVMDQPVRAFVFVGVLGGFTTFSSFMLDTFVLANGGDRTLAVANVVAQTGLGLLTVYLGYQIGALR
jgi:fluoride exporter